MVPDGTKIVFARGGDKNDIYIVDVDGSGLVNLTNTPGVDDTMPVWSPDDSKIAFLSDRDGNRVDLFVMGTDGSNPVNITKSPNADEDYPAWSPDGKRIAFVLGPEGSGGRGGDLMVMATDGSAPVNLTKSGGSQNRAPVWSPDGAKLAFQSDRDGHKDSDGYTMDDIYVVTVDGLGLINLTNDPAHDDTWPDWSPDGKWITYEKAPMG